MSDVLSTRGISVRFGGVHAVREVDLAVPEGKLVGLIGPNGAGKTTFIDAITGFVPAGGTVKLGDDDLTRLGSHKRASLGLARTWQTIELFDDLTVTENLEVAAERPRLQTTLREVLWKAQPPTESVLEALDLLGLRHMREALPADLSQGQRKLIGVARALAAQPRVLCLDEPAAGLDTTESQEFGVVLRRLVDGGLPMLLIDHDMALVLSICDYLYVIDFGTVIAQGTPQQVRTDPRVIAAYLGGSSDGGDHAS
ncbi:ABC transporter ATP-binding protein [Conexibacter sp. CPCC 206217]|uniref:ABC transporter ATP-binding protein n=1 Tax=Conexibacter sp. CPCC 206217 TaxID=3064574 RepID=UPI0027164F45|nr:ABC transporter ATP-binding protein [Conexibacter sp. CPCC 206217]MDO8213130.1 ABC transporter ATP-binding protein [Conexibacter sp. CPCC 206217]